MDYIYIDEKGPQETIRITAPYDEEMKIKLGSDRMNVYVADLIKVNEAHLHEVEKRFVLIEETYKSSRRFSSQRELKGMDIIKDNFEFGIASLKDNELHLFHSLFDLLLETKVENLLFSINKMSLVADKRLRSWILNLEEKRLIDSAWLLKYSLVKYLEIEASSEVVKTIFDLTKSNKEVLTEIQKDMTAFVHKHKHIRRMELQLLEYKKIIQTIRNTKHFVRDRPFDKVSFDWEKVSFDVDLWLTEMFFANKYNKSSTELILDQGIPVEPFKNLQISSIKNDQNSTEHVGLRISDILVVLSGKYMSKFTRELKYDKNSPEKRKVLSIEWFQLDEKQFHLIKKIKEYLFPEHSMYCFIVDTYFDDSVFFETYLKYISNYETFDKYIKDLHNHSEQHFAFFTNLAITRWQTAINKEREISATYGSVNSGINKGIVRPI
ncbi:hypothetical protein [Metabacillus malikii]|uniref:DUF2357 domain-containing protein n=1 Tax=Metabacillus malikii TaxID=1504265 RepID=A0ABT9ZA82_9BACI|nr:hypothetical protein [Metabacillus malikii]MDQ0229165.1 hypothetical protein [Metabacillus malikii]